MSARGTLTARVCCTGECEQESEKESVIAVKEAMTLVVNQRMHDFLIPIVVGNLTDWSSAVDRKSGDAREQRLAMRVATLNHS